MPRNLDRRIELVFPIEDEDLKQRAFETLDILLSDNTNARMMLPDTYRRAQERLKAKQEVEKDSPLIPIHSSEEAGTP